MWGICCCGGPGPPGRDEPGEDGGGEGSQQSSMSASLTTALYNRFGTVERFRHKDTLVFLGCSLLLLFGLLLLVQYMARPPTCQLDQPIHSLPINVQKLLLRSRYEDMEWKCNAGPDYDIVFRMILSPFSYEGKGMTTAIMPQECRVEPKPNADFDSVPSSCPCWPGCDCVEKYIWDKACRLQIPNSVLLNQATGVWGWYFSLMSLVLAGLLLFACVFKIATFCCGGKREGIAVVV